MALGAMSQNPSLKVKIVPGESSFLISLPGFPPIASNAHAPLSLCSRLIPLSVGLSYFHPHKFRSRAVVEFGAPMDVPPELVEEFGKGGKEKREACQKLLDLIYDGLKTVTIRTPDWETLMVSFSRFKNETAETRLTHLPSFFPLSLLSLPGDPSRSSSLQDSRPVPHSRPDRRTQQTLHRRISPLPERTARRRSSRAHHQVQPEAEGSRTERSSGGESYKGWVDEFGVVVLSVGFAVGLECFGVARSDSS